MYKSYQIQSVQDIDTLRVIAPVVLTLELTAVSTLLDSMKTGHNLLSLQHLATMCGSIRRPYDYAPVWGAVVSIRYTYLASN